MSRRSLLLAYVLAYVLATAVAACGQTGGSIEPPRQPSTPTVLDTVATAASAVAVAVPAALSMTADEAEARALARLDPERDPRVELVRLVPAQLLRNLWPLDACCAELALPEDGPVFVAIVTAPSLQLLSRRHVASAAASPVCELVAPELVRLAVLFDAATGDELGAWTVADEAFASAVGDLPSPSVDEETGAQLRAARAPTEAPSVASPRPLPASRFLAPPEWTPFDPARLSDAAMTTLRGFPLAPNHWWAYRVLEWAGPVANDPGSEGRWRRAAFTESVRAAWLVGPEAAVFDLERGIRWQWPPDHDPTTEPAVVRARPDKVLLDGGAFYPSTRADVAPMARLPASAGDLWALGASDNPSQRWEVVVVEELVTTAGTFEACVAVRRVVGAGAEHWRWLCPGVGIAREEHVSCGAGATAAAAIELTGFDVSTSLAP